jgi:hypothetical protein
MIAFCILRPDYSAIAEVKKGKIFWEVKAYRFHDIDT